MLYDLDLPPPLPQDILWSPYNHRHSHYRGSIPELYPPFAENDSNMIVSSTRHVVGIPTFILPII